MVVRLKRETTVPGSLIAIGTRGHEYLIEAIPPMPFGEFEDPFDPVFCADFGQGSGVRASRRNKHYTKTI